MDMTQRTKARSARKRAALALALLAPLAATLMQCTSSNPKGQRQDDLSIILPFLRGEVHGSLYLGSRDDVGAFVGTKGKEKIFVPDLLVALKQASTGTKVATTKTD